MQWMTSVAESVRHDPKDHDFVSLTDIGEPVGTQLQCNDCQFERAYDEVLFGSPAVPKLSQSTLICKQCSFYWRGPSRYAVCSRCRKEYDSDRLEEFEEGIVNNHTRIILDWEPKVKRLYDESMKKK